MTDKQHYIKRLQDMYCDLEFSNKYEFLCMHVFNVHTYVVEYNVRVGKMFCYVIELILYKRQFEEFQRSDEAHWAYCLIVNYPFLSEKINYGTSIRGCWFEDATFIDTGILDEPIKIIPFMEAIIEWVKL